MTMKDSDKTFKVNLVHYDYSLALLEAQKYIQAGLVVDAMKSYNTGGIFYTTLTKTTHIEAEKKESSREISEEELRLQTLKETLMSMDWDELKKYGNSMGVSDRSRPKLVKKIMEVLNAEKEKSDSN